MLIDVDVSCGHWPFQRLAVDSLPALTRWVERYEIDLALVAAVETALYPDPHEFNAILLERLAGQPALRPVPVVNPSLPGTERRLEEYLAHPAVVAVKVLPGYHLYALDAPEVDALAAALTAADVPLLVHVRLEDERNQYPLLQVAGVDVHQVRALAQRHPDLRLACLCPYLGEAVQLTRDVPNIWVDLACVETLDTAAALLQQVRPDRVLFGSHTPFLYTGANLAKLRSDLLTAAQRDAIAGGNAAALLGTTRRASPAAG